MLITIVDTETTGLDTNTCSVVEVGAILYSVEHCRIVNQLSFLFPLNNTGEEAYVIHGINSSLTQLSIGFSELKQVLEDWIKVSSYVVSHNVEFDSALIKGIESNKWLCTYRDFRWPKSKSRELIKIALAYDVPVISAHRALTDCNLIASIFTKLGKDLEQYIQEALKPLHFVVINHPTFLKKEQCHPYNLSFGEVKLSYGNREEIVKKWHGWLRQEQIDNLPSYLSQYMIIGESIRA